MPLTDSERRDPQFARMFIRLFGRRNWRMIVGREPSRPTTSGVWGQGTAPPFPPRPAIRTSADRAAFTSSFGSLSGGDTIRAITGKANTPIVIYVGPESISDRCGE